MKLLWILVVGLAATACGKSAAPSKDRAPPVPTTADAAPRPAADDIPADGLTFPPVAPAVGDKVVVTSSRTRSVMAADRPGIQVTTAVVREEDTEVMAVDGDRVTRLKVGYRTCSSTEVVGNTSTELPIPTAGQTYLVWREGDALQATRADGAPVSPEELATLGKHQARVGRPDGLQAVVAARRWKRDEPVPLAATDLARVAPAVVGEDPDARLVAMGLTLQSADAKRAVFAVTATIERAGTAGSATQALTGLVKVQRVGGRVLEVHLGGPIADGGGASGTMDAITRFTY